VSDVASGVNYSVYGQHSSTSDKIFRWYPVCFLFRWLISMERGSSRRLAPADRAPDPFPSTTTRNTAPYPQHRCVASQTLGLERAWGARPRLAISNRKNHLNLQAGPGFRELQAEPVEDDASQLRLVKQLVPFCFLPIAAVEGTRSDATECRKLLDSTTRRRFSRPL
jgi:hypothetical protein